jgi:hypothetical protein
MCFHVLVQFFPLLKPKFVIIMEIAFIGVIIFNIVYESEIIIMDNYGRVQLQFN